MTVELLRKKYPIGTRIKVKYVDIFGDKLYKMATVKSHAHNVLYVDFDDGTHTGLMPGYDSFSVIYHE